MLKYDKEGHLLRNWIQIPTTEDEKGVTVCLKDNTEWDTRFLYLMYGIPTLKAGIYSIIPWSSTKCNVKSFNFFSMVFVKYNSDSTKPYSFHLKPQPLK